MRVIWTWSILSRLGKERKGQGRILKEVTSWLSPTECFGFIRRKRAEKVVKAMGKRQGCSLSKGEE